MLGIQRCELRVGVGTTLPEGSVARQVLLAIRTPAHIAFHRQAKEVTFIHLENTTREHNSRLPGA